MSNPLRSAIDGIFRDIVSFGKTVYFNLKNVAGVAEFRNSADNAYATLRAANIQASNAINDVATLLDIQWKDIQYSFNGASAPNPGDNTAKFGFVHTTGGSYTAGQVVYDTGTAIVVMPSGTCLVISSRTAVTGTISLQANGIYVNQGGTWTLKGDGAASDTGFLKSVAIDVTHASGNVDSTTSIPTNAVVTKVICNVSEAFDGTAPTLAVSINGSSPLTVMATTDNNLKVANQYDIDSVAVVGATNTGVVRVAVTPDSSATGEAKVIVYYTTAGA